MQCSALVPTAIRTDVLPFKRTAAKFRTGFHRAFPPAAFPLAAFRTVFRTHSCPPSLPAGGGSGNTPDPAEPSSRQAGGTAAATDNSRNAAHVARDEREQLPKMGTMGLAGVGGVGGAGGGGGGGAFGAGAMEPIGLPREGARIMDGRMASRDGDKYVSMVRRGRKASCSCWEAVVVVAIARRWKAAGVGCMVLLRWIWYRV